MADFHQRLTALRHDLHRHPELGFAEVRPRAIVAHHLRDREPVGFPADFAHLTDLVSGCFLLLGNGMDGANAWPLQAAGFWAQLVRDRLAPKGAENG